MSMKMASNDGIYSQFFLIAGWFIITLVAGIMYRMVLVTLYFELPCMILLCQSLACLILIQALKLLFPEMCNSWSTSVDLRALPVSILFTISTILDMVSYYQCSMLLGCVAAPAIALILSRPAISKRSKFPKKLSFALSCFSVLFTYLTVNASGLTADGLPFGFATLLFNIATFFTLRNYLRRNPISQFLFSHFSFQIIIFFIYELYQHDVHRLYLYINIWKLPNFYSVLFTFIFHFSLSLVFMCHVIVQFDLSLIAACFNTKYALQFIITNFVFRNVAFKPYYDLTPSMYISSIISLLVSLTKFWIDVKK